MQAEIEDTRRSNAELPTARKPQRDLQERATPSIRAIGQYRPFSPIFTAINQLMFDVDLMQVLAGSLKVPRPQTVCWNGLIPISGWCRIMKRTSKRPVLRISVFCLPNSTVIVRVAPSLSSAGLLHASCSGPQVPANTDDHGDDHYSHIPAGQHLEQCLRQIMLRPTDVRTPIMMAIIVQLQFTLSISHL
jgi:hypothetical protein